MENKALWIGGCMLLFLIFFMFVGPYLPFVDRELTEVKHRFTNIEGKRLQLPAFAPSEINPLGSDKKGVDNLSKLIIGAKESVFIVLAVAFLRYAMAIPLGLLAYKQKGFANTILTALNTIFSYIPTIIAAVLIMTLPFFKASDNRFFWGLLFMALLEVGRVAYIVQQQANKISHETYVLAGAVLGLSRWRMIKSCYMPTLMPEIIVNFVLDIGKVMLLIGQLGVLQIFLTHKLEDIGFGVYKFVNKGLNWFALLAEHRMDIYYNKFAFVFFPALAIMFVILTFNVLGEGLRQHFNRKMINYY